MTPHTYAGGTLDRAGPQRQDAAWVEQAWRRADCRIVPLWRGQCLIAADGGAALLPARWAGAQPPLGLEWALLGLTAETAVPVFALELGEGDPPELLIPPDAGDFVDLRVAAGNLAMSQAALLAYAKALLGWRRTVRFCGVCGAACRVEQAGHVSICTSCATAFFPRTDPTVIMLVTLDPRASPA
jgi:NAD+ diphosphatase